MNPECRRTVEAWDRDKQKYVSIRTAAHNFAASANGPRGDASLLPEQLKAVDNGLYLCASCARLIDSDDATHPVERLNSWKEYSYQQQLAGVRAPYAPQFLSAAGSRRLSTFLWKVSTVTRKLSAHPNSDPLVRFHHAIWVESLQIIDEAPKIREHHHLWSSGHPTIVGRQLDVIRQLEEIRSQLLQDRTGWGLDPSDQNYRVLYQQRPLGSLNHESFAADLMRRKDSIFHCVNELQSLIEGEQLPPL